jgi:hypothetical protein
LAKIFFKITRKGGDSISASLDKDVVVIKSNSKEANEYVVLDKSDLEGILWNYADLTGFKIVKNKR